MKKNFSIIQKTLPFDVGFFSPDSVCSIIQNPVINLYYPDNYKTHKICYKYEKYDEYNIKFVTSTYENINKSVVESQKNDINIYLDSTYGYYTLDTSHNYILAHYNWHPLADVNKSHGITDPKENLRNITNILNKRIKRMFDIVEHTKYVFFVYYNPQKYKYMIIDDRYFDLDDLSNLKYLIEKKFGKNKIVIRSDDLSIDDIINLFE